MENKGPIRYKHTVNSGDLIANLCAMRHVWKVSGRKAKIYQLLDMGAMYYPGATHPVLDDGGNMVTMNQKMFDMLKPLVMEQEYVQCFEVFTGQEIDIDLGAMRGQYQVNMPYMDIRLWPSLIWPDMCPDLTKSWLGTPGSNDIHVSIEVAVESGYKLESTHNKVILNFTERYRNTNIHYFWLKDYQQYCVFAGTEEECAIFNDKWKLSIPHLKVNNFLELAIAIKNSRFLLGNQSMNWGIADAMKTRRILEYCTWVPNCTWGIGKNSVAFLYQQNLEWYFKTFLKETEYSL